MSEAKPPPPKVRVTVRVDIDGKMMSHYSEDTNEDDIDKIIDNASCFLTVNVWNEYHRINKAREDG